jgi:hypothetical protein
MAYKKLICIVTVCLLFCKISISNQPKPTTKKGIFCSYNAEKNLLLYKKVDKPETENAQLWLYDIKKQKDVVICDTIDNLNPTPVFYDSVTILIPTTDGIIAFNLMSKTKATVFKTKHTDQFLDGFYYDPLSHNIITILEDFKSSEAFLLIMNKKGEVLNKMKVPYNFDNAEELSYSRIFIHNNDAIVFNALNKLFYFNIHQNKVSFITDLKFAYDYPVFFVSDSAIVYCKKNTLDMLFVNKIGSVSNKVKIPPPFNKNGNFDFLAYTFQVKDQYVNYIVNKQKTMKIMANKLVPGNNMVSIISTPDYSITQDILNYRIVILNN